MDPANFSVDDLGQIIGCTFSALESTSVPSKNPFQYLEIGLQTAFNHFKAGALFWMIGLDSLLAAQNEKRFASRLCRLLGKDSYVFPADCAGRQPAYKIGNVASDVYHLRNEIGHGDRIREEYMRRGEFRLEPPINYYLPAHETSYQSVLLESALFILIAALRKVILDGHLNLLANPRAWKRYLGN